VVSKRKDVEREKVVRRWYVVVKERAGDVVARLEFGPRVKPGVRRSSQLIWKGLFSAIACTL
jgi:hypothetical protein